MERLNEFLKIDIWGIVKWLFVAGFGLYLVFSLVVWRQIELMGRTLNGTLQLPIRLIGVVLVVISMTVLILAVVIL